MPEICPTCKKEKLAICEPLDEEIQLKCFGCNKFYSLPQDKFTQARMNMQMLAANHVASVFSHNKRISRDEWNEMYEEADKQIRQLQEASK